VLVTVIILPSITTHNGDGKFQNSAITLNFAQLVKYSQQ